MSDRDIEIARLAYRLGRQDTARYAGVALRDAHVDGQNVDKVAAMVWAVMSDACERDPFEALPDTRKAQIRLVAHRAMEMVGAALARALDHAPPDPVSFSSIVRAVDFDPDAPEQACDRFVPRSGPLSVFCARECVGLGLVQCPACGRMR
jgi:hypothetical protein